MTGELLIRNMHVLWKIVELIETEDSIAVSVFADICEFDKYKYVYKIQRSKSKRNLKMRRAGLSKGPAV